MYRSYLEFCSEKYEIDANHFQNETIGLLEKIHVIELFLLPPDILIYILTSFISIDSLTVFDTSISDVDSRRYLLQYIFPSPKFVVLSNDANKSLSRMYGKLDAYEFSCWMVRRNISVRDLDFSSWIWQGLTEKFATKLFGQCSLHYRYQNIQTLILPGQKFQMSDHFATKLSVRVNKLKHLKLYCYDDALDEDNFALITRRNRDLQTLEISFSCGIPGTAFDDVTDNCKQLKQFLWRGHGCRSYVFIEQIATKCLKLEVLDLFTNRGTYLVDQWFSFLERSPSFPSLKVLNLSGCTRLTKFTFLKLFSAVKTLEYFGMYNSDKAVLSFDDECLTQLAQNSPNLKKIDIRGCIGVTNLSMLDVSLNCPFILELVIGRTGINDDCYEFFKNRLHVTTSPHALHLDDDIYIKHPSIRAFPELMFL